LIEVVIYISLVSFYAIVSFPVCYYVIARCNRLFRHSI